MRDEDRELFSLRIFVISVGTVFLPDEDCHKL